MKSRFGIDVGNTNTKVFALPDKPFNAHDGDLTSWAFSNSGVSVPSTFRDVAMAASRIDIVSVDPLRSAAMGDEVQKGGAPVHHWTSATLPIKNAYVDDATLGPDRPLAGLAAWYEFKCPVVVIDAGTALTVDVVNAEGFFLGGAIAPGLRTIETALGDSGAMLHEIEATQTQYPGESTSDCLKIGAYEMYAGGLLRLTEAALEREPNAKVVVTGGDWQTCLDVLAKYDPISRPLLRIGLSLLSWWDEQ